VRGVQGMTTRCSTGQALHDAYWAKIREASLGGWDLVTTARAEFLDYERHRAYCAIWNPNIQAEIQPAPAEQLEAV